MFAKLYLKNVKLVKVKCFQSIKNKTNHKNESIRESQAKKRIKGWQ